MSIPNSMPPLLIGLTDGPIRCLHPSPDGSVLFGGRFDHVRGAESGNMARLLPDGSLDPVLLAEAVNVGSVLAMAQGEDGRMATGGWRGAHTSALARFGRDGKLEAGAGDGLHDALYVSALAWAPGGRLIMALKGTAGDGRLALLGPDGSPGPFLDGRGGFTCDAADASATLRTIHLQDEGMLLVGGHFDVFDGVKCRGLVRMDMNGRVDAGFRAELDQGGTVVGVHPLMDGSIVVHLFVGATRGRCHRLYRLHADGRPDLGFVPERSFEGEVACVVVTSDVLYIAEAIQRSNGHVLTCIHRCAPAAGGRPVAVTMMEGLVRVMAPALKGGILVAADLPGADGSRAYGLAHLATDQVG